MTLHSSRERDTLQEKTCGPERTISAPGRLKPGSAIALLLIIGLLSFLVGHPAFGDERMEARRHFQNGMALVEAGNYLEGIEELKSAYEILPHPSVLYNIGRAYLDAGQPTEAIDYLQRYLATDPPDRGDVEPLLEQARAQALALKVAEANPSGETSGPSSMPSPAEVVSPPEGATVSRTEGGTPSSGEASAPSGVGASSTPSTAGVGQASLANGAGGGSSSTSAGGFQATAGVTAVPPSPERLQQIAGELERVSERLGTLLAEVQEVSAAPGASGESGNGGSTEAEGAPTNATSAGAVTRSGATGGDGREVSGGPAGTRTEGGTGADAQGADTLGGAAHPGTAAGEIIGERAGGTGQEDPYAPVVVTSSRYSQSPLEAPNALSVLTAGEIERSGARTIPDLLRQIPGLDVMALSPSDFNVGIRGLNSVLSNKVLVLIDGRSLYLDFIGATFWPLMSISISDIERVEVIRGPGAALYGANAFSGVINIITKRPGMEGDRSRATIRGGYPDWSEGSLHVSGREGRTGYRASLGFEQAEHWSNGVDESRSDYQIMARYPDMATHVRRFDIRIDHRIAKETSLSVSGGMSSGQVEFNAIGALRDFLVDASYGYVRADLFLPQGLSMRAFWNRFDGFACPWSIPVGGEDLSSHPRTDIIDFEAEWLNNFHALVDHRLNVGLGFRFKAITWEWLSTDQQEAHASLFVQDELRLAEPLIGVLSLRVDRHPVLAENQDALFTDRYPISPRAALVWRLSPAQSFRTTVGTAFRTPTFLENYIYQHIPTTTDSVMVLNAGNLLLAPEKILSAEIGYLNQPARARFEIEAAAYVNKVSNLVELSSVVPWSDPETVYDDRGFYYAGTTHFQNAEDVYTAMGGEIGGRWFPIDGVDFFANYAYEKILRGAGSDADQVLSTSPHKFNAGARVTSKWGLSAGADLHLVSKEIWPLRSFDANGQAVVTETRVPAYSRLGLRLGYGTPDGRLDVSVTGTNLLAFVRGEVVGSEEDVATPAGRHREHPLGEAIPAGVSAMVGVRF